MQAVTNKFKEVGDYLKANPSIATMLLAGGGAGLAGGMLTGNSPERAGESSKDRRLRILRNALLTAGAGAGAAGLGMYGYDKFKNAIPEGMPHPAQEALTSTPARTLGAAGGAALMQRLGNKGDIADEFAAAAKIIPKDTADILKDPAAIISRARTDNPNGLKVNYTGPANRAVNFATAGHADKPIQKLLASILYRNTEPSLEGALEPGKSKFPEKVLAKAHDIFGDAPKLREGLNKILGGRRRQLGVLGLALGAMAPEIFSGAKRLALEE